MRGRHPADSVSGNSGRRPRVAQLSSSLGPRDQPAGIGSHLRSCSFPSRRFFFEPEESSFENFCNIVRTAGHHDGSTVIISGGQGGSHGAVPVLPWTLVPWHNMSILGLRPGVIFMLFLPSLYSPLPISVIPFTTIA